MIGRLTVSPIVVGSSAAIARAIFARSLRALLSEYRRSNPIATRPVKKTDTTAVTPIATPSRPRRLRIGLISDAAQRLDDRAPLAELLPHRLHMRVDRARVDGPLVSPYPFEQPVPAEYDPPVPHEEGQEVELARGELHGLLAH